MQRLKQVHTPRLSFLMRDSTKPFTRPLVRTILPPLSDYDDEDGESLNPRANPAFTDAWFTAATGGANRVIPQGIDYSRTPCCAGLSGADSFSLIIGAIGVPIALFAIIAILGTRGYRQEREEDW